MNTTIGNLIDNKMTINSTLATIQISTEKTLLDLIYPIGAIYWSSVSTSPETLFGGEWT